MRRLYFSGNSASVSTSAGFRWAVVLRHEGPTDFLSEKQQTHKIMTHLVEVQGEADEGVMSRSGTIHFHSFQTRFPFRSMMCYRQYGGVLTVNTRTELKSLVEYLLAKLKKKL